MTCDDRGNVENDGGYDDGDDIDAWMLIVLMTTVFGSDNDDDKILIRVTFDCIW